MTRWHLALANCFTETTLQMRKPRLTQASLSKVQKLVSGEDVISIYPSDYEFYALKDYRGGEMYFMISI